MFDFYLEPIFSSLNFGGVFTMKGGDVGEGMSCIFNKNKFQLVMSHKYVLAQELSTNSLLSDVWQVVQSNEKLSERILKRTTSCQIIVLDAVDHPKRLVVANTHLYFHPNADHIRLLQATIFMRLAHNIYKENRVTFIRTLLRFVLNLKLLLVGSR